MAVEGAALPKVWKGNALSRVTARLPLAGHLTVVLQTEY